MKATGDGRDPGFDRLMERELDREGARPCATACPQVELLAAWFDGSLAEAGAASSAEGREAEAIEAHAATCGRCQEVLAGLARSQPQTLYVAARPTPKPVSWHMRWFVPVAAAAIVVVAVGSQVVRAPSSSSATANALKAREALQQAAPPAPSTAAPSTMATPPQTAPAPRVARRADAQLPAVGAERADAKAPAVAREQAAAKAETRAEAQVPADAAKRKAEGAAERFLAAPSPAAAGPLPAAFVVGGKVGWRYLRPGVVLATRDAGETWAEQALPAGARLSQLSAVSPSVCWGVGPAGTIVRTEDGRTWLAVPPPARVDIVAVTALGPTRASVKSGDGATYETRDAGATWQRR